MKTHRINLEHLSVSDLEGRTLYVVDPDSPRAAERLKPVHMHIFGNGNLLICPEETSRNSLAFGQDGRSLYSSLELHEEVQEGWVVLEFDTQGWWQQLPGEDVILQWRTLTVYTEEQAREVHASRPHSILINLAETGPKE